MRLLLTGFYAWIAVGLVGCAVEATEDPSQPSESVAVEDERPPLPGGVAEQRNDGYCVFLVPEMTADGVVIGKPLLLPCPLNTEPYDPRELEQAPDEGDIRQWSLPIRAAAH